MKGACIIKYRNILKLDFPNFNAVFTRVIVHSLLAMIEKWKTAFDNEGVFTAILTDLSKAFDCIPQDLIIAKLTAYGFDTNALKQIHDYLSNRKQRVKVNSAYSIWKDTFYGVRQGSIFRPLLFNINLCDLFYFLENTDIASYADNNTLYSVEKNRETVINTIELNSLKFFLIGLVTIL